MTAVISDHHHDGARRYRHARAGRRWPARRHHRHHPRRPDHHGAGHPSRRHACVAANRHRCSQNWFSSDRADRPHRRRPGHRHPDHAVADLGPDPCHGRRNWAPHGRHSAAPCHHGHHAHRGHHGRVVRHQDATAGDRRPFCCAAPPGGGWCVARPRPLAHAAQVGLRIVRCAPAQRPRPGGRCRAGPASARNPASSRAATASRRSGCVSGG